MHITSRLLLSFLLLWQLGASVFVHAHGVAAMRMQHDTAHVADPVPAVEEHCADHAAMPADVSMEMSAHAHMAAGDNLTVLQDDSAAGCCQSLLCNCPCIQALAMSPSLPYVPTALPDALPAQAGVTPLLHAGISGLFRPPI